MRVTWISSFSVSIILEYFDDCALFPMESLMIGIILRRDIDSDPISHLKSSH